MTTTAGGATSTAVPGLLLRPVRWPEEAATLNDINNSGRIATGNLEVLSVEGFLNDYAHLVHSDLAADLRVAEHDGRPVAYVRVEWQDELRGGRLHVQALMTRPDAPAGTFEAILDWGESRSRAVAATLRADPPATLGAFLNEETPAHRAILEARGYHAVRSFFGMVRPTLDDIPDLPLPPGVQVRPVRPEDVRTIWRPRSMPSPALGLQRGRRQRGGGSASVTSRSTTRRLAGGVGRRRHRRDGPPVHQPPTEVFGVRRGWCEHSTHADWRGRGIAKASSRGRSSPSATGA
jgi:hypothetical protein